MHFVRNYTQMNRRTMLKRTAAFGAATALGTLAAPAIRAGEDRKVTFANVEGIGGTADLLQNSFAKYTAETGVEVEMSTVSLDQVWINVQASLRSGKPIDIFMDGFIGHVALLAEEDAIVPLNQITDKYKWGPQILFPINDQAYWMPYDYNFATMHYNKKTYSDNGWKPAANHAEFLEINKALTKDGNVGSIFPMETGASTNWESTGFFWAEDCKIFDDNWNVIIDTDAEQRAKYELVLDFMYNLSPYMPKDVASLSWWEGLNAFEAGTNGHFAFVPIPIEEAHINNTALKGQIGLSAFPSSDGKKRGLCHGYDGISVTKSANTEEALKFLEWFADNTYVELIASRPLFFQPPRLDIYSDPRYTENPIVKDNPEEVAFLQSVLSDENIIVRSIDSTGPAISNISAKVFQSFAFSTMLQERLLKNTPAAQCVDIGAKIMRDAIAT